MASRRTQINEDGAGHIATAGALSVVDIDAILLKFRFALESSRLNNTRVSTPSMKLIILFLALSYLIEAVLLGDALPETMSDLVTIVIRKQIRQLRC